MKSATPRWATALPRGKGWLPEIEAAAARQGTPLMPWQLQGARFVAARRRDGRPRFKLVALSVPRQSGKTTLTRPVLDARARQGDGLRMYATAQTRVHAAGHLEDLGDVLAGEVKTLRGAGGERITWPNGSRLQIFAPNATGGHGPAVDLVLLDEVWALITEVMGGISPAMVARPLSQILAISTMGTVESDVWNRIVARGREAVDDPDSDMAFLEYSAPDDAAVFDESRWHEWMPALGITVTMDDIRFQRDNLEPAEFIRAFGNRVTTALNSVFPVEWVTAAWTVLAPVQDIVLGVDVNDAPAGATVAAASLVDGDPSVRVLDWRDGSPAWVPGKVAEVAAVRDVAAVSVDFGGPARAVKAELEAVCETVNVAVVDRRPRDVAADTSRFYDGLRGGRLRLERMTALEDAINGAYRKNVGDLWFPSRRRMVKDASPLIAAILAAGLAVELDVRPVAKPNILVLGQ